MPVTTANLTLLLTLTFIYIYNSSRKKSNLKRAAIVSPESSPWLKLYEDGDDSSFLTVTGFSREAFNCLMNEIFIFRNKGRKSLLQDHAKLGVLLLYLGSRMELKFLSMIFGVTPSTISRAIHEMLDRVITSLESNPISEIRFPTNDEMAEFAALVNQREPEISNVIGFVDGVSCPVQCSEIEEEQALHYNGYHHDTMVNNVLAFSPKGKIIYACLNFPGSWHDTNVASSLINVVCE